MDKTMTDTLNWIYTKDHKPSWEECKGKMVVYHRDTWTPQEQGSVNPYRMDFDNWVYIFSEDGVNPFTDRYILIDIPEFIPDPEPVPCKVCGGKAFEYARADGYWRIRCNKLDADRTIGFHVIGFDAPTRDEAVSLWNKHNS